MDQKLSHQQEIHVDDNYSEFRAVSCGVAQLGCLRILFFHHFYKWWEDNRYKTFAKSCAYFACHYKRYYIILNKVTDAKLLSIIVDDKMPLKIVTDLMVVKMGRSMAATKHCRKFMPGCLTKWLSNH